MNLACTSEKCVHNEYALRFSVVSKPAPVLEYIKAISSLIGASNILAVFEENEDTIKIYFDGKRFVDILLKSPIHVLGRHVRIDYVVPPGTKIFISNVDPVISNLDLMSLLSMYGTIVSPVIRPPISDDTELCHIGHGVRYVYMIIRDPIPNDLEFKYGDQLCTVKITMDEIYPVIPYIKPDIESSEAELQQNDSSYDTAIAGPSSSDNCIIVNNSDPVPVIVEATTSDINLCEQISDPMPLLTRGNPAGCQCQLSKRNICVCARLTPASRAANRIKNNVRNKWMGKRKRGRPRMKDVKIKQTTKIVEKPPPDLSPSSPISKSDHSSPTPQKSSVSSSDVDNSSTPPLSNNEPVTYTAGIFDKDTLEKFLDEVKHQRVPLECAKKYLGANCNKNMLLQLIKQLSEYNTTTHDNLSLKLRIQRLIKMLTDAMN